MPPTDVTDTTKLFDALCKEWQQLNKLLPGIKSAENHAGIIEKIKEIYILYKSYQVYELPLRREELIREGSKTENELNELDEIGLIDVCELQIFDVAKELNDKFPLSMTVNIARNISVLPSKVIHYLSSPSPRHKIYYDDPHVALVHVTSILNFIEYIDTLCGEVANSDQFASKIVDSIIIDPVLQKLDEEEEKIARLFGQPRLSRNARRASAMSQNVHRDDPALNAIIAAQQEMINARAGTSEEKYLGLNEQEAVSQRAKDQKEAQRAREDLENNARVIAKRQALVNRVNRQSLIQFAKDEPRGKLLYERAFVEWAELLIQQASFYCIKYPLADSFHSRHHVVYAIIEETVKYLNQPSRSTIDRMISLAQFVLRQDIGNGVLLKLLTPALKEIPEFEYYPFDLYGKDKTGRDALIAQLKTFKESDRYIQFDFGYESQSIFKENLEPIRHKPLEKIEPGEIKLRLHKLPSNVLRNSVDTLAPTAMRRFLNWLRGLLTQGKLREQMIQDYKNHNPDVLVTEEGFIKGPPPVA